MLFSKLQEYIYDSVLGQSTNGEQSCGGVPAEDKEEPREHPQGDP